MKFLFALVVFMFGLNFSATATEMSCVRDRDTKMPVEANALSTFNLEGCPTSIAVKGKEIVGDGLFLLSLVEVLELKNAGGYPCSYVSADNMLSAYRFYCQKQ